MPQLTTNQRASAIRRAARRLLPAVLLASLAIPAGGTVAAPLQRHTAGHLGAAGGPASYAALTIGGCCATRVAWSPDGRTLAVNGTDALRLLHTGGQTIATIAGLPSPILDLAWSADGALLATGSRDGLVRTYDASGRAVATLGGHAGAVNAVGWSHDGRLLATASADGGVRIYQRNGELLTTLFAGYHLSAGALSWSSLHTAHGTVLAYATSDGVAIETVGGRLVALLDRGLGVASLAWSPDGQLLATGLRDGTVQLWGAGGILLTAIHGLKAPVTSVAWSPDGLRIAAAAADRAVQLWDAVGQPVATLSGPPAAVQSLSWSPDGHTLAGASGGPALNLWHLAG